MSPLVETILLKTLFAVIGLAFLFVAIREIRKGWLDPPEWDSSPPIRRDKHPILFWIGVIIWFALSAVCFLAAILGKAGQHEGFF